MQNFKSVSNSFADTLHNSESISLKSVRLSRLCYIFAYALELVLFSVRGHFMPIGDGIFGLNGRTVAMAVHGIASLIVMLLWSERFKRLVWASVIVCVAGFVPFILLYDSPYRFLFSLIAYAGLGGVVTSARCGFAFAINNAERIVGMIFMFISCTVVRYIDTDTANMLWWAKILPLILLAAMCLCLVMFKEKDLEVKEESTKQDEKGMYWGLTYFILYFAIDGYIWSFLDSDNRYEYKFLLVGTLLSAVILFGSILVLKLNMRHIWNIFFVFAVIMAMLAVFSVQRPSLLKTQYFFSGLSLMGWPFSIYMLACIQRRYASYKLLKKCTLIFVLASPIANLPDEIISYRFPQYTPVAMLIVVLVCVVFLLITAPMHYKHLFDSPWAKQISEEDMALLQQKVEEKDRFEKYGLTPRQKEIAALLLAAKTRRQIAGELGVSESTVKNHTSELYKKLGINSRVELFRIFGVDENTNEE